MPPDLFPVGGFLAVSFRDNPVKHRGDNRLAAGLLAKKNRENNEGANKCALSI